MSSYEKRCKGFWDMKDGIVKTTELMEVFFFIRITLFVPGGGNSYYFQSLNPQDEDERGSGSWSGDGDPTAELSR